MLNDNVQGMEHLKKLNGKIIIIPGNHDTPNRLKLYDSLDNVTVFGSNMLSLGALATLLRYKKYTIYLSHYPTMTDNGEANYLRAHVINIYGHTHQKEQFYKDIPYMFHAGMDSNNCTPVLLDDAIEIMKGKISNE